MDIQQQLRHAAQVMREGGVFDRESTARLIERAARDIDSMTFTIGQYRDEYESAAAVTELDATNHAYDLAELVDRENP